MTSHFVVVSDARFIPELNKLVDTPFIDLTHQVLSEPMPVHLLVNGAAEEQRLPELLKQEAIKVIRAMVMGHGARNICLVMPTFSGEYIDAAMRAPFIKEFVLNYSNVLFLGEGFARLMKYHPSPELNFQLLLEMIDKHTTAFRFTDDMPTRREREAAKRSYLRGEHPVTTEGPADEHPIARV